MSESNNTVMTSQPKRHSLFVCFTSLLAIILFACISSLHAQSAPLLSNPAGQALAAQLRAVRPEQNSEIRGVLKIRNEGGRQEIPVQSKVIVHDGTFETVYITKPVGPHPAEQLTVIHSTTAPNKYLYAKAKTTSDGLPSPQPISANKAATIRFADSDFSLADLGLDFLHWPEQKRLTGELRLGRDCYLLESQNPKAPEMVRVKSWIDKESNGILVAEGYNAKSNLVKEFSLSGSSFKKINGRWQLKKMTIRSPKKKSETVLEFELPKDE